MSKVQIERQIACNTWGKEVFGKAKDGFSMATRASKEMSELLRAISKEGDVPTITDVARDHIAEECADTLIILYRIADLEDGVVVWDEELSADNACAITMEATAANVYVACIMDLYASFRHGRERKNYTAKQVGLNLTYIANCFHRICLAIGRDLGDAIDAKMLVNRQRVWSVGPDGTGEHVRTPLPSMDHQTQRVDSLVDEQYETGGC